ncbi:MAG TPA: acyl-ACP desaturase [Candidatus Binatus sp.]|nr:acyl-ACP desaturase [Candidatus Binatus sp.]
MANVSSAFSVGPLVELEPVVAKFLDRHLATAKEWFPHDYVPWNRGRDFTDAPWQPADSTLSPAARTALELNLLTEDNLPYYHLALWGLFGGEGAWGEWARRWTAEEGRYSIAIRDYLLLTRAVDPVALERERMDHVSRGFYPRGMAGPLDGLVYVTLQELATRIAHRNTGALTGDPIAERLLVRVALDENLHYTFYRDVAAAAIELDASAMVLAMKRQVLGFAMPGLELRGFRERAITIAAAGVYDLRIHHDQVLCPVLLNHWKLRALRGLSDEAERARDDVLGFLENLGGTHAKPERDRGPTEVTAPPE